MIITNLQINLNFHIIIILFPCYLYLDSYSNLTLKVTYDSCILCKLFYLPFYPLLVDIGDIYI